MSKQAKYQKIIDRFLAEVDSVGLEKYAHEQEDYKYLAVDMFQQNFKMDAADPVLMIEAALPTSNLTSSANYFPLRMMSNGFKEKPEETRGALMVLFDEVRPLVDRMKDFKREMDKIVDEGNRRLGENKKSFCDPRFASLLLALRYPDRYYHLKAREWNKFMEEVSGQKFVFNQPETYSKVAPWADELRSLLMKNSHVRKVHEELVKKSQFKDEQYMWMTPEVIYRSFDEPDQDHSPVENGGSGNCIGRKQTIYSGPPGTGKTYSTRRAALSIINPDNMSIKNVNEEYKKMRDEGRIEFVTFHPSYSYEEFIEGITISDRNSKGGDATNGAIYARKPGLFKRLCTRALWSALGVANGDDGKWSEAYLEYGKRKKVEWDKAPKFVLIIDEINRGDISKIFGELITLVEEDKRLGSVNGNDLTSTLPVSGESFGVPANVYILATMNTADRSLALLDVALRRRFSFHKVEPELDLVLKKEANPNLKRFGDDASIKLLEASVAAVKNINKRLAAEKSIGRDKMIGHAYLMRTTSYCDVVDTWRNEILPLIEEYCYGDDDKISRVLGLEDTWPTSMETVDLIQVLSEASDV